MIVIDQEFQSLIPPLSDDEYEGLEKSILTEGFHEWEPIVTWNGTIIDGHNRYAICDEHGIAFKTVERDFPSRDAAKIWILDHQMNRRNLSSGQRSALVIDKREAEVREQARLRQAKGRPKKLGIKRAQVFLSPTQTNITNQTGARLRFLLERLASGVRPSSGS